MIVYRLVGVRRVSSPISLLQAHLTRKSGEIIEKQVKGVWVPLPGYTSKLTYASTCAILGA